MNDVFESKRNPRILLVGVPSGGLKNYAEQIKQISPSIDVGVCIEDSLSEMQEQDYDLVLLETKEMDESQINNYFEGKKFPKTVVSIGEQDWQLSAHCLKMGAIDCVSNLRSRVDLLNLLKSSLPVALLPIGGI